MRRGAYVGSIPHNEVPLCTSKSHAPVAQLVEQWPFKPTVTGSIPVGCTPKDNKKGPFLLNRPVNADVRGWFGILAPAATPKLIIDRLHKEISAILQMPEIKSKLMSQGAQLTTKTPAEFSNFIRMELAKWTEMIKTTGVKAD